MAGTVSIANSQRLDITNGRLLSGGKLYFYAAGSTTPQLAYRDSGLTLPHPNPVTLASDGMIPDLYFADGSIRCRLLNSAGVVQFDRDNMLVNGPSSGGGGGSGTDPNAIFQTGDVMWLDVAGTRAGWVRDNGRTIGSATSGASERANSDCQPLFLYLWANFSDTLSPVGSGRGVSAAADWAANKQITLPDKRGFVSGGLDDMGNAAASRYSGVPFASGNALTAGSPCGETAHTQITAEMPAHSHGITEPNGGTGHAHGTPGLGGFVTTGGGGTAATGAGALGSSNNTGVAPTGIVINSTGSGSSMNITQRTIVGTFFRKL